MPSSICEVSGMLRSSSLLPLQVLRHRRDPYCQHIHIFTIGAQEYDLHLCRENPVPEVLVLTYVLSQWWESESA